MFAPGPLNSLGGSALIRAIYYPQIWFYFLSNKIAPTRSFPRMKGCPITGNVGLAPTTTGPVIKLEWIYTLCSGTVIVFM